MLDTDRLKIVPLEAQYLEELRRLRNDPTTWHWLTDITPISVEQQKAWFEKLSQDKTKLYFAILQKPQPTTIYGYVPPAKFIGILRSDEWDRVNRSVRIGVDIVPEFRGQGYATEAFKAFITYLFNQQNMHRVWFFVADANKIATKLYEKCGFKIEGKQRDALFRDGKYWDYIMMSLLEGEWKKNTK